MIERQTQAVAPPRAGTIRLISDIVRVEGVLVFYRGLVPTVSDAVAKQGIRRAYACDPLMHVLKNLPVCSSIR